MANLDLPHELVSRYDPEHTGKTLVCRDVMIHEGDKGIKYLYKLNVLQRMFITVEDPNGSQLGGFIGMFMFCVIILSCTVYVISSLNVFKVPTSACAQPVCSNDPTLCPKQTVCEPNDSDWTNVVELLCVIIFTIEYGFRLLLVWCAPPRLCHISRSREEKDLGNFDQTKESSDTVFLEEIKFLRRHISVYDQNINDLRHKMRLHVFSRFDALATAAAVKLSSDDDDNLMRGISHIGAAEEEIVRSDEWYSKQTERWNRFSVLSDECHSYSGLYKTLLYACKPLNLIDLLAILPFYIELIIASGANVAVVRVLRLARVFRVFKMGRNSKGVEILYKTFYTSMPALTLLAFFIALGVVLFGAVMHFIESGTYSVTQDYPNGAFLRKNNLGVDEVSPYTSILAACYWAVVCSTTVGYGDLVPTSTAGKFIAVLCAYYGVLLLALPITVIGSNFSKLYEASHGKDDEMLVLDCLDSIAKAIYLECSNAERAVATTLSDVTNTITTSTQSIIASKLMGLISTFDQTKQNLMKAAISNANDKINKDKLKELKVALSTKKGDNQRQVLSQPSPSAKTSRLFNSSKSRGAASSIKQDGGQPLRMLNLKPSEAVDLLVGKKRSIIRDLDVVWSMPREPSELNKAFPPFGRPPSQARGVFKLYDFKKQLLQLRDSIVQRNFSHH